jgi:cytochrome bd-type quinol oxidase subunit 2
MDEKRRPRVYVVNRSTHDYSSATKYGDIVYVTEGYLRHFSVGLHTRVWQEKLKDSLPDDFLILSSINVVCGIGCALFAMMHGKLNLLLWDNKKYIKREVLLTEVLAMDKLTPFWAVPLLRTYADEAEEEKVDGRHPTEA